MGGACFGGVSFACAYVCGVFAGGVCMGGGWAWGVWVGECVLVGWGGISIGVGWLGWSVGWDFGGLGVWRFCLTALLSGHVVGFSGASAHGFNRAVER